MTAINKDFVVKNGLQVSTNLVVGTYTLNTTPITNGAIISGSVGIGTTNPNALLALMSSGTGASINFNINSLPNSATRGGLINYWTDGSTYFNDFWNNIFSNKNINKTIDKNKKYEEINIENIIYKNNIYFFDSKHNVKNQNLFQVPMAPRREIFLIITRLASI